MPTTIHSVAWRCLLGAALVARHVDAQIPGLPVLQSAFPAPGLAVAANYGHAEGRSLFAGAVGYGQRSSRFGLVAGVGATTPVAPGFGGSRIGYGARAAVTVLRLADERIALAAFAGFGSSRAKLTDPAIAGLGAAAGTSGQVVQRDHIPLGVAAGWRFALGETRAVALTVAPMYALYRRSGADVDATAWRLRTAALAEVAVTPRIGLSVGTELGQSASATAPGPHGSSVGVAASFAIARHGH